MASKTTSKTAMANQSSTSRAAGATGSGGRTDVSVHEGAQPAEPAGITEQSSVAGETARAIDALKQDHRRVEHLFAEYESSNDEEVKGKLIRQICSELIIHTRLEEEIFYRACREAGCGKDIMDEAQVEHDGAKLLIADLLAAAPDEPFTDAKVSILSEQIKHHVAEEEKAGQ